VPDHAQLYDRVTPLSDVLDSIVHRTTVVRGARLMGKTSLLNVVAQSAERQGKFAVIRIAPADSRAAFMAEILDGIYHWVDEHRRYSSHMHAPEQPVSTVAQFCKHIAMLVEQAAAVVFVLCVDEFDSLVQNLDEHEARLVLELIEHLDAMPKLPIRFLLTISVIPDLVLRSFRSPILNQSKIVTLEPWDADDAARFVEWLVGDWFIFDTAALVTMFAAAGGHPYFTKAVLNILLAEQPCTPGSRKVSAAQVATAVRQAVRSPEVDIALTNLVGVHLSPEAAGAIDRIGNSRAGVTVRSLSDLPSPGLTLSGLQASSLLRRQGDRYLLRLGLWREWRAASGATGVQPPPLRRIGRTAARIRFRRATSYVLLSVVAAPLLTVLVATAYLAPERTIVARPCGASAAKLAVSATYPAFASIGDRQHIHVVVLNKGQTEVRGSALVRFSPGQARTESANGLQFNMLRPGQEAILEVDFTPIASAGWPPLSRLHVGVELSVSAPGACLTQRWSMSIAPIPRLQPIQKVAGTVLVVFLIPLAAEFVARLLLHDGHSSRAGLDATKDG
jgi:hypothetical protein